MDNFAEPLTDGSPAPKAASMPESEPMDTTVGVNQLKLEVQRLQDELERQEDMISALTNELSARDERINAILTCRAWRWSQYGSVIKRIFLSPPYRFVRKLFFDGKVSAHPARLQPTVPAPKPDILSAEDKSITLLPSPRLRGIGNATSQLDGKARARLDVICFSIIDWNFRYQRPQQVMSAFAERGHRVFYIRLDKTLPAHSQDRFSLSKIKENVYEITLLGLAPARINQEEIRGTQAHLMLRSLDAVRQAYRIVDAIAYVMTPSWTSLALEVKRRWGWRLVYDCMDEWQGFPGMSWLTSRAEPGLVQHCDLLLVTARRLYDKWRTPERQPVLAPNAVDIDFYEERCQPNVLLKHEPHPIVGYYGAIADWFDRDLMLYVARQRPGYTFVLLGGVFEVDVSELRRLPNVRVLGQQAYETMPQYLYHFDACLIPFKINKTTEATDPVKVYEYLSAGKPVVSVALPEVEPFSDLLYIAHDHDSFLLQLDRAVSENDPVMRQRRRDFAAENTWAKRYETISGALREATPPVSIIVVTFNNLAINRLCLESIIRNTDYPNYEVIVVDNNSTDGTPDYLRQLAAQDQHLKVIFNDENAGFARANNEGIAQSRGERLVLLNNDTIVPRSWLTRLVRHLDNPAIGLVGPLTNFTGNESKIEVAYQTLAEMESFTEQLIWQKESQVADIHMLAMFCVAMRRETYDRVGPLDEQFGLGMFEDDDYSLRVKKLGLRVVCAADVFVHHFGQAAFRKLIDNGEYEKIFVENRRRFETKWNVTWIPHKNASLTFKSVVSKAPAP